MNNQFKNGFLVLVFGFFLNNVLAHEGHYHDESFNIDELPPVVINTIPESGARGVSSDLNEIKVTFNKRMTDESWSWAQASEASFPEITDDIYYEEDMQTCVMPVKLEPNKTYLIWLNSQQFRNFRDESGRPAIPYMLYFETEHVHDHQHESEDIPLRPDDAPDTTIDLTNFYTHNLNDSWLPEDFVKNIFDDSDALISQFPQGIHSYDKIQFDIRGVIQFAGRFLSEDLYPSEVKNIPVDQKFNSLHAVLSGIVPTNISIGDNVGVFVLHYEDGTSTELDITNGVHLVNWASGDQLPDDANAQIAWSVKEHQTEEFQGNEMVTFVKISTYKSSWQNPHPDKKIKNISIISDDQTSLMVFGVSVK